MDNEPALHEHAYNIWLPDRLSPENLELLCFLNDHKPEDGGLGKAGHFRKFVELVWGPGSRKEFIWNPWCERMLEYACTTKYLGIIGCGNSSKTSFAAIWALVNWLASRFDTKVMVTSTSLKESRKRIWGAVTEYYLAVKDLPGRLVDSMGIIRANIEGDEIASDRCGIELIPGEKKKEAQAIGKLIGIKAKRVILICDELPELSEALLSASFANLALNPNFQLIGIGNFNSMYDPLGLFVEPKGGWSTVTTDDEIWETEKGVTIRFDGLKSPNILSGRNEWPHIYTSRDLAEHKKTLGENTALFWRMCRSFPCPEGEEHVIFSEADLARGNVHAKAIWLDAKTPIAAIDPSFTSGGDRTVMVTGYYGLSNRGCWTISFEKAMILEENLDLKDVARNRQIAMQFIRRCQQHGVRPEHAAYDATAAGGIMFGELLAELWSAKCLGVNFGGAPSDLQVSDYDPRIAKDAFMNRVSELWYVASSFVINGQIKQLPHEVVKEWKARRFETKKIGSLRTVIESKRDMKLRTGKSPDFGDAAVILVDLCRERLGAVAGGGIQEGEDGERKDWDSTARYYDSAYDPETSFAYDGTQRPY